MEKIGLISTEFTEFYRKLTSRLKAISDENLRIGYTRSLKGLEDKNSSDAIWSREMGIEMPDAYQELLRNCDMLLCEAKAGSYLPELPLMSAKRTLLCVDKSLSAAELKNWVEIAENYKTNIGIVFKDDDNIEEITAQAANFFQTGISPETII